MGNRIGPIIYPAAVAIGIAVALWMFPLWALVGGIPPGAPPVADFAQQVVGQRYFLAAPWHWPLLNAPGLIAPFGVNIAFTDSNPLALLVAKTLRPILPPFDQVITIWQVLCWSLQPAAAIFALRGTGERRLLPAVAIAVMAASQPAFLGRMWHAQLDSHFTILGMLGLYFRAVRDDHGWRILPNIFLPFLLLIHPYILAMDAMILMAIPLTLATRRDPRWRKAAVLAGASIAVTAGLAIILGYTKGKSPGGYGFYSMNLLSPFYPAKSALFPGFDDIDATGGQRSGYNYLGAGLLLLLACAVVFCRRNIKAAMSRHRGLMLACTCLFLVALSNRVYIGHHLLFKLHTAVGPLQTLRASGRLFWPISYALLAGSIAILAASRPRIAMICLPLAALLQFLDGAALRKGDYQSLHEPQPWLFDPSALRDLTRHSAALVVLPVFGCTPGRDMPLMQVLWIGSETLMPTNTMYVARKVHEQSCDILQALEAPPAPGTLLVIQPGFRAALGPAAWAQTECRQLADYSVCSPDNKRLTAFATLPALR